MRCARLLTRLAERIGHPVDRVHGHDRVVEVHPAAALTVWDLPTTGYKGAAGTGARAAMLDTIRARAGLTWTPEVETRLVDDDNTFDALICALVARTVSLGLTHLPAGRQEHLAATEGWLHVPHPRTLEELTAPRP